MAKTDKVEIEVDAIVDDAVKDLQKTDDAIEKIDKTAKKSSGGFSAASASVIAFNQALELAQKALKIAGDIYDVTVGKLIKTADGVDNLSRSLGISAAEASKLTLMTDDLFVSQETLEVAMRYAVKNGIDPSIEGLKELAIKYQAIEDPIARSQFVMETFGARADEMNKILEVSPDKIDAMVESYEKTGLVLDDVAIESTREYKRALDDLGDAFDSILLSLGQQFVPVLTSILKPIADTINRFNEARQGLKDFKNEIVENSATYEEFIAKFQEATAGYETNTNALKVYGQEQNIAVDYTRIMTEAEFEKIKAMQEDDGATRAAALASSNLAAAMDEVTAAQKGLESAQRSWLDSTANEVVTALGALKVTGDDYKNALGAVDEVLGTSKLQEQEHKEKVDAIVQAYADTKNIDDFKLALQGLKDEELPKTTDALEKARSKAQELEDVVKRLAEIKEFDIKVNFVTSGNANDIFNATSTPPGNP